MWDQHSIFMIWLETPILEEFREHILQYKRFLDYICMQYKRFLDYIFMQYKRFLDYIL